MRPSVCVRCRRLYIGVEHRQRRCGVCLIEVGRYVNWTSGGRSKRGVVVRVNGPEMIRVEIDPDVGRFVWLPRHRCWLDGHPHPRDRAVTSDVSGQV